MLNLVLVGFMGTGKSTVGRQAAALLGLPFHDTDKEIENIMEMPVKDIFRKYGETRFRSEETAAIKRLVPKGPQVLATGGGIVLKEENMLLLRENGLIICLNASPEEIFRRVGKKKNRPLLAGENPMEAIRALLKEREPYYKNSGHQVATDGKSVDEVVREVVALYSLEREKRGSGNGKGFR